MAATSSAIFIYILLYLVQMSLHKDKLSELLRGIFVVVDFWKYSGMALHVQAMDTRMFLSSQTSLE